MALEDPPQGLYLMVMETGTGVAPKRTRTRPNLIEPAVRIHNPEAFSHETPSFLVRAFYFPADSVCVGRAMEYILLRTLLETLGTTSAQVP
jgi:hypothetical protein